MTLRSGLLLGSALGCLVSALPAGAAPLKVGSGNEAVIAPPVPHPNETPCVVTLTTDAKFGANSVPFAYTPPAACPGPWAKVVLTLDISLNPGRQFDRSGQLYLAGVPLWFGTTAEPRATLAPKWHVEKDVTPYTALYGAAQTGSLLIVNYQSSVYTSTITASASLLFYPPTASDPAPATADMVLPVPTGGGLATLGSSTDQLAFTGTLPTNILRATLDLYLQGQNQDEFWYLNAPSDVAGELETYGNTAFREGEITVDGTPAGVAPIYPWIFTGGIDPYLWQPIPGVQTLDFQAFHADLSPFAGVLSNGASHTIATTVFNVGSYFSATGALLLFLDHGTATVTGGITKNTLKPAAPDVVENLVNANGAITGTIKTTSKHDFTISGTVTGSQGTVTHTISEQTAFSNLQKFDVSATKDFDNLTQSTDTTIVTSSKGAGIDTSTTVTLNYPLTVFYNFVTGKRGNSTQVTKVDQQWLYSSLSEANGTPTAQDFVTNAIQTGDELFFNSSFSVTGHKGQTETAAFARTGTSAPCFKRKLVSTYNVLTTVQTGC